MAAHLAFQTFIGTVKSASAPSRGSTPSTFQTLIGTVKRSLAGYRLPYPAPVSNPHRYGQKKCLPVGGRRGPVFQTLIGTVKRRAGGSMQAYAFAFQTLIGRLAFLRAALPFTRCFKPS